MSNSADQQSDSYKDEYGDSYQATQGKDPRFGWLAPFDLSSQYIVPNSNIVLSTQIQKSANLSNTNDPLSVMTLTSSTTLQNDPSRTFTSSYSAQTRTITLTSPLNRVVSESLNANGLLSTIQTGSLNPIYLNYDSRGRVSNLAESNRQMEITYDNHGNISSSTDFLGRTTSFAYDNANRVTQETLPDGSIVAMTYDSNGNMTSITPPGRSAHTFSYNLFELLQSYLPPSLGSQISGATTYSYNLDKQLTQINRSDGAQVNLNYDATTGLLTSVEIPEGIFSYGYSSNSDLVSALSSPDGESMLFQYAGQLLTSVNTTGPVSMQLRKGLFSSLLYLFVLIPIWGGLNLLLFVQVHQSKIAFVVGTFIGWAFLIFKFVKVYSRSLICPRCGNIYNMAGGHGVRIPFVKKCQSCGLPIGEQERA